MNEVGVSEVKKRRASWATPATLHGYTERVPCVRSRLTDTAREQEAKNLSGGVHIHVRD